MAQSVYVETTIVSYLTARPSRDAIREGQQQLTRLWWSTRRAAFDLFTSEIVVIEAAAGDAVAAKERLDTLRPIPRLDILEIAVDVSEALLATAALPIVAARDSQHVGICAANGIDFLLTWNCRHLANAVLRDKIEEVCESFGFRPPKICTPEELLGETYG
jgi:hypothetical protein